MAPLSWARLDSNQRATSYEPAALPLSYRPAGIRMLPFAFREPFLGLRVERLDCIIPNLYSTNIDIIVRSSTLGS